MENKEIRPEIEDWRDDVVSAEFFLAERPNLTTFGDQDIISARNSSIGLLNAECNGLIKECWFVEDTTSDLYRTYEEHSYIKEACIIQIQHFLNLGGDYTDGSTSFSIGNVNLSSQRPIDKLNIAPGVLVLLQKAKVYQLQATFGYSAATSSKTACQLTTQLTTDTGDRRYIKVDQVGTGAQPGSVLTVNEKKEATFEDPQRINFSNFDANRIWDNGYGGTGHDPQNVVGAFKYINQVLNLAWFGDNTWNAMTRNEIYDLISSSNLLWSMYTNYKQGAVVDFLKVIGDKTYLLQAISLNNGNVGNDPALDTAEQYWKQLPNSPIPIEDIVEMTIARLTEKPAPDADSILTSEINNVLDTYPNVNFKNELANRLIAFSDGVERDKFIADNALVAGTDYDFFTDDASVSFAPSFVVKNYQNNKVIGNIGYSMDATAAEEILTIESNSTTSQRIKFANEQGGVVSLTGVNDPINDFDVVNYRTLKREASGKWTKLVQTTSGTGSAIGWTGNYAEYSIYGELSVRYVLGASDTFISVNFSPLLIPHNTEWSSLNDIPVGLFFRADNGAPMGNLAIKFGSQNKLIFKPYTGEIIAFSIGRTSFDILGRGKQ